jgi:hypothetical protein
MIPAAIVFLYLAVVVYIGVFAFRKARGKEEVEDYFLASRSLGPFVFLMSLFGTNMTAFAILGSSGHAFNNGIVTYGLMASSSGLVIPLTIFFIGTRVWALGKRFGFITPVQLFRTAGSARTSDRHLRRPGRAAAALRDHRRDGRRDDAERGVGRPRPLLDGRRRGGAGGDELRLLRRDARDGLGEHLPDRALPALRLRRGDRDRLGHGRLPRRGGGPARLAQRLPAHPRKSPALLLLQLHVHPPLGHRLPPHHDLLPHGAAHGPVRQDRDLLPGAASWPSGCPACSWA